MDFASEGKGYTEEKITAILLAMFKKATSEVLGEAFALFPGGRLILKLCVGVYAHWDTLGKLKEDAEDAMRLVLGLQEHVHIAQEALGEDKLQALNDAIMNVRHCYTRYSNMTTFQPGKCKEELLKYTEKIKEETLILSFELTAISKQEIIELGDRVSTLEKKLESLQSEVDELRQKYLELNEKLRAQGGEKLENGDFVKGSKEEREMKDLLATKPDPNRDPADVQKENDLLRHNLETAATTFSGFKNQAKAVVGTAQRTIFNKLENSPMLGARVKQVQGVFESLGISKETGFGALDLQGFFEKESNSHAGIWQKRWFVLNKKSGSLVYYKDSTQTKLHGEFSLANCKLLSCPQSLHISTSNNRTYKLRTSNATQMKQWADALSKFTQVMTENTSRLLQSYFEKESGGHKGLWQRRWVVLDSSGNIVIYEDDKRVNRRGEFSMIDSKFMVDQSTNCLNITTAHTRTYKLRTKDPKQLEEWTDALNKIVNKGGLRR